MATWTEVVASNLTSVRYLDCHQIPLEEFVPTSYVTGNLIRFTAKSCLGYESCGLQYITWESVMDGMSIRLLTYYDSKLVEFLGTSLDGMVPMPASSNGMYSIFDCSVFVFHSGKLSRTILAWKSFGIRGHDATW